MMSFATAVLVKATLVILTALAATRLARRTRAALRHVLLAAAFAVLLALPLASLFAPSISVPLPVQVYAPVAPFQMDTLADADVADMRAARGRAGATEPAPRVPRWPSWPVLAWAIWALGVCLFLLPVVTGLLELRRLRRTGLPWRHGQSIVDALAREAAIRRRVNLLLHEGVAGPMTCGVLRPAILLPIDAQRWDGQNLWRAIVHELEHVRRGDWVSQCVARVASACYWFHPFVWIAWREMSLEAERACDDAVLRKGEPTAYADQLVHLAERLSAVSSRHALAMASRRDLPARVRAVLDSGQARGRAGAAAVGAICAAAAILAAALSPIRIVASVQTSLTSASNGRPERTAAAQSATSQKFAAVTIKPCVPEPLPPGAGGRGRGAGGGNVSASPGTLRVDCMTVQSMIDRAYLFFGEPLLNESGPGREDTPRVKGGPGWIRSERFTIEAKADGAADRKTMMGPMLRAFLEERLQVQVHRDVEDIPAYALTVAKGGLKIKPLGEGGCTAYDPANPQASSPPGGPPPCGRIERGMSGSMRVLDLGGMELEILMTVLKIDRHVIDRTGLPDTARFNIHFIYEDETPEDGTDPAGPSVFRALEQQLGLKLEPIKAQHGVLIVDRVVRP